jgi:undecaprenyl-diphosphatase
MTLIQAIIIAIVEGLTEFLPVSSTGHMIIAQHLLGAPDDEFTKIFIITTQFAAILSVVLLYWKRFFQSLDFYFKLFVAFIPAVVLGLLLEDWIDSLLESVTVVATTLLLGGIVLIFIDKYLNPKTEAEITYPIALKIGLFQCLAMVPGVSRSAATIIGGMQQKLSRSLAAEFSFFLAVPTMAAATLYSLFLKDWQGNGIEEKGYQIILASSENIQAFVIGNIIAFVVALLAIKFFIGFLQKHGFRLFGWYRIVAGGVILFLVLTGKLK